mmetsp:Transcript_44686/g.133478  ORF Transcript_44686/g.133478 Transcript_44686/m.133478 type:complete len:224 (-) Transcript_44686:355-1026(-)
MEEQEQHVAQREADVCELQGTAAPARILGPVAAEKLLVQRLEVRRIVKAAPAAAVENLLNKCTAVGGEEHVHQDPEVRIHFAPVVSEGVWHGAAQEREGPRHDCGVRMQLPAEIGSQHADLSQGCCLCAATGAGRCGQTLALWCQEELHYCPQQVRLREERVAVAHAVEAAGEPDDAPVGLDPGLRSVSHDAPQGLQSLCSPSQHVTLLAELGPKAGRSTDNL